MDAKGREFKRDNGTMGLSGNGKEGSRKGAQAQEKALNENT